MIHFCEFECLKMCWKMFVIHKMYVQVKIWVLNLENKTKKKRQQLIC